MNEHDKLDQFLDRALAEYSDVRPRAELESRILTNLQMPQRPRRWWWAAVLIPAAAVLIILAVLWRPTPRSIVENVPTVVEAPLLPLSSPRTNLSAVVRKPRPVAGNSVPKDAPASEPKLSTFPSQDSTDQIARLAMQFVSTYPAQANELVTEQNEFRELAAALPDEPGLHDQERRKQ